MKRLLWIGGLGICAVLLAGGWARFAMPSGSGEVKLSDSTRTPSADSQNVPPTSPSTAFADGTKQEEPPALEPRRPNDWIEVLASSSRPADWLEAHKAVQRCVMQEALRRENPSVPEEPVIHLSEGKSVDCKSLTAEQRRDHLTWLTKAVANEVTSAAVQQWIAGPNGHPEDLTARRDDPLVRAWMRDTESALIGAAKKGDVEAIASLSTIYGNGTIAEADAEKSAMLDVVLLKIRESEGARTQSFGRVVDGHRRRLGAEKMQAIEREADAYYLQCCKAR